jgi:hypothetical protein
MLQREFWNFAGQLTKTTGEVLFFRREKFRLQDQ